MGSTGRWGAYGTLTTDRPKGRDLLKHSKRIAAVLAIAAVGMLVVASSALASHPRPKSATPAAFKLVPAFQACGAPNGTHGAPLALPSCGPPSQSSAYLTLNAPDRPA